MTCYDELRGSLAAAPLRPLPLTLPYVSLTIVQLVQSLYQNLSLIQ
jgi:hypothetical protein